MNPVLSLNILFFSYSHSVQYKNLMTSCTSVASGIYKYTIKELEFHWLSLNLNSVRRNALRQGSLTFCSINDLAWSPPSRHSFESSSA